MTKFNKRDLKMILAVVTPGEPIISQRIADLIAMCFKQEYTNREVALAITWNLNTTFEKTREDSTEVYTYMRKII